MIQVMIKKTMSAQVIELLTTGKGGICLFNVDSNNEGYCQNWAYMVECARSQPACLSVV